MKKLTRRAYNRKIMMFGAAIFMSIAMISTGFAAWVMSSVTKVENAAGPVVVSTVSDKVVEITVTQWDGAAWTGDTLTFDAEKGDKDGRVINSDATGTNGANLKLTVTGEVTNHTALATLTATIKLPKSLVDAIDANYIAIDKVGGKAFDASKLAAAASDGTKTYTLEMTPAATFDASIEFKWGTAFGGVNPSVYYDSDATGKTVSNGDMKDQMNAFAEVLQAGLKSDNAEVPTYSGTIYITVDGTTN